MNRFWTGLAVLVVTQICYPLTSGAGRAGLVVVTVLCGFGLSVGHALATRGPRTALVLVLVAAGGGLVVEAVGVATGLPFGRYAYGDALGWKLAGVPVVVPLAGCPWSSPSPGPGWPGPPGWRLDCW